MRLFNMVHHYVGPHGTPLLSQQVCFSTHCHDLIGLTTVMHVTCPLHSGPKVETGG